MAIIAPVKLAFRCDSSSHRDARYMVVGGVAYQTRRHNDIANSIQGIKDAGGLKSEMKWSKFRGGERSEAYKSTIELLFSLIEQNHLHLHLLIADFSKFSHRAFAGGSSESSVNRMYFQLLVHRVARFYAHKCYIFVYPDHGNDSRELSTYHGAMNFVANRRYGVEHRIAKIEQADSEKCPILQMVDVVLGGVAHARNFPSATKSIPTGPKAALAKFILERSGLPSWDSDTPLKTRRLTVWNFQQQKLLAGDKVPYGARRYIRQG